MDRRFPYFLLLALCSYSCVSILDFENENTGGQLSVYGQINDSGLHNQYIRVTRATSSRTPSKIVNTATVQVSDDLGCTHLYYYDTLERYYVPYESFVGIPGVTYQLTLELDGEVYQSSPQKMPLHRGIDTTYFEIKEVPILTVAAGERSAFFMQVFTDTEIPSSEEPVFLRWNILQVFIQRGIILPSSNFPGWVQSNCFVEDPYVGNNLLLFDGSEVQVTQINGQFMAETPLDDSFNTLRGFGVVQQSITEEALNYWKRIEEVSNRDGSIFETPPAAVPGNIINVNDPDDFALGFFEVARVDTTGTYALQEELPLYIGLGGNYVACDEIPFSVLFSVPYQCYECLEDIGVDPVCLNCTLLPNSSPIRPPYLDY